MTDTCEIEIERMEVQEIFPNSPVEVATNCSSTDLEVGGSVGISDAEERVAESGRASTAIEESGQEETKRRCAVEITVAWKIFKTIIFIICLVFLVIQSLEFLGVYYKYPTTIELETTLVTDFKRPAITLCFRNTMSYEKFCSYHPERCERPKNSKEFCTERPSDCRGETLKIPIPMQDTQTREIIQTYLFNDSYNDDDLFQDYDYTSKVRTFIRDFEDYSLFLKCYSENLHVYQSGSKLETKKLNFVEEKGDLISSIELGQINIEPFYPLDTPQVFLAIHSPYVPLNPEEDLHPVKPERWYKNYVQLEKEEHLLPPPYQTDCRDNGPSKDAKESTNPNSFQMCLDLCRSEFYKRMYNCVGGMMMAPTKPDDRCFEVFDESDLSDEQEVEPWHKRLSCFKNCKQGCLMKQLMDKTPMDSVEDLVARYVLGKRTSTKVAGFQSIHFIHTWKLHYKTTIKENDLRDDIYGGRSSEIEIYVKNPEVTVLRHVPLYGSGEIFSHVGGLLGCWLGISVFTFTDIVEKFFLKIVRWQKRF